MLQKRPKREPKKRVEKPYDHWLKYRQRTIEKLQPLNTPKPVRKKRKKLPKLRDKKIEQNTPQYSPENQPRDEAGKWKKVPLHERGFFAKLYAWKSGEMKRHIARQKANNRRLAWKSLGLDLPKRRRRRRPRNK